MTRERNNLMRKFFLLMTMCTSVSASQNDNTNQMQKIDTLNECPTINVKMLEKAYFSDDKILIHDGYKYRLSAQEKLEDPEVGFFPDFAKFFADMNNTVISNGYASRNKNGAINNCTYSINSNSVGYSQFNLYPVSVHAASLESIATQGVEKNIDVVHNIEIRDSQQDKILLENKPKEKAKKEEEQKKNVETLIPLYSSSHSSDLINYEEIENEVVNILKQDESQKLKTIHDLKTSANNSIDTSAFVMLYLLNPEDRDLRKIAERHVNMIMEKFKSNGHMSLPYSMRFIPYLLYPGVIEKIKGNEKSSISNGMTEFLQSNFGILEKGQIVSILNQKIIMLYQQGAEGLSLYRLCATLKQMLMDSETKERGANLLNELLLTQNHKFLDNFVRDLGYYTLFDSYITDIIDKILDLPVPIFTKARFIISLKELNNETKMEYLDNFYNSLDTNAQQELETEILDYGKSMSNNFIIEFVYWKELDRHLGTNTMQGSVVSHALDIIDKIFGLRVSIFKKISFIISLNRLDDEEKIEYLDNLYERADTKTQQELKTILLDLGKKIQSSLGNRIIDFVDFKDPQFRKHPIAVPRFSTNQNFIISSLVLEKGENATIKCPSNHESIQRDTLTEFREGKIYMNNIPLTVRDEIYVISPKGFLYTSDVTKVNVGHHHHFLKSKVEKLWYGCGKPVACAGHITIKDGKITAIDSRSGHYQPDRDQLLLAAHYLYQKGLLDENCIIHTANIIYGSEMEVIGVTFDTPILMEEIKNLREEDIQKILKKYN